MPPIEPARAVALYTRLLTAWNRRSADDFAALFTPDGSSIGFDGSPLDGRAAIADALREIFAHHPTPAYVAKVREVRALDETVVLLRAVAGMVPAGTTTLRGELNALQSAVLVERDGSLAIALFHNTPAAFHGRPAACEALTAELTAIARSGAIVA